MGWGYLWMAWMAQLWLGEAHDNADDRRSNFSPPFISCVVFSTTIGNLCMLNLTLGLSGWYW